MVNALGLLGQLDMDSTMVSSAIDPVVRVEVFVHRDLEHRRSTLAV